MGRLIWSPHFFNYITLNYRRLPPPPFLVRPPPIDRLAPGLCAAFEALLLARFDRAAGVHFEAFLSELTADWRIVAEVLFACRLDVVAPCVLLLLAGTAL